MVKSIGKNIVWLILLVSSLGCSQWLDVNSDPNVAKKVPSALLLPAGQASLATTVGGSLFNLGGLWTQYWTQAPEANQYNGLDKYDIKTTWADDLWEELYAGGLNDLEELRKQTTASKDWGNYLVATTLRAYTFQLLVDLFDKVPYSEALKGVDNFSPNYDDGEKIYNAIIQELDEALKKIDASSKVASSDLMLKGDLKQWQGFAKALKLKLYMRKPDGAKSAEAKKLVDEGGFFTGDVSFSGYTDVENKRNPWYATNVSRLGGINHVATGNIIQFMQGDPRLAAKWKKSQAGSTYKGLFPGASKLSGLKRDNYSLPEMSATQSVSLFTQAELQLFIAEVELKDGKKDLAKAAYEKAIDAGFAMYSLKKSSDYYKTGGKWAFDVSKSEDELMERIMMEKWLSLCMVNHIEAWTEFRRTDIPKKDDNITALANGDMPDNYNPHYS